MASFLFWGFVGFAICVAAYGIQCWASKIKPELPVIVIFLFSCTAISASAELCWQCILARIHKQPISLAGENLDIVIGGCISMVFISFLAVIREFSKKSGA